jgi:hypothetical protein
LPSGSQQEFRSDVAGLFGALGLAARDQLAGGSMHALDPVLADVVWRAAGFEFGLEGIETVLQGHGNLPSVGVGLQIWFIC